MHHELTRPVDLQHDPLWVCELIQLAADRYVWYHRAHHIILDGYGASLLSNRLAVLYTALVAKQEPPPHDFGRLTELLEEEDAYRASERFERDRRFWREQLAHLPDPVSLASRVSPGAQGLLRRTARLSAESTRPLARHRQSLSTAACRRSSLHWPRRSTSAARMRTIWSSVCP